MSLIINHDHPKYRQKWKKIGSGKYNGAFYYSKEICKNIIPRVKTDRPWITIKVPGTACDHAIVFIHNNLDPSSYDYLKDYDDLILVCGIPETVPKVAHLGKAIYLPLSVDVQYVSQFKRKKTKGTACVGRRDKLEKSMNLPRTVDWICGVKRQYMLPMMAQYEKIYAVGRTAIEARILGCEILPYDERFPDVDRWQILDNREAAVMLQKMIDEIDGVDK